MKNTTALTLIVATNALALTGLLGLGAYLGLRPAPQVSSPQTPLALHKTNAVPHPLTTHSASVAPSLFDQKSYALEKIEDTAQRQLVEYGQKLVSET